MFLWIVLEVQFRSRSARWSNCLMFCSGSGGAGVGVAAGVALEAVVFVRSKRGEVLW